MFYSKRYAQAAGPGKRGQGCGAAGGGLLVVGCGVWGVRTSKMRTENGGNEVEKWSGGHSWASRGTLRTTSGGLRPLGVAREPKRDENGSYYIPPGRPFWLKNRKTTSKK